MSRRYGRNQKRKHRETIQNLTESFKIATEKINGLSSAYLNLNKECMKAKKKLNDVVLLLEALSPDTIFKDPEQVKYAIHGEFPDMQNAITRSDNYLLICGDSVHIEPSGMLETFISLPRLEFFIDKNRKQYDTLAHLRLYNHSESSYYISDKAMRLFESPVIYEQLLKNVIDPMLRCLVKEMK